MIKVTSQLTLTYTYSYCSKHDALMHLRVRHVNQS